MLPRQSGVLAWSPGVEKGAEGPLVTCVGPYSTCSPLVTTEGDESLVAPKSLL